MIKKKFSEVHNETNVVPLMQMLNYGYPSDELGTLLKIEPMNFIGLYKNETVTFYCDVDYWTQVGDMIIELAQKDHGFFTNLVTRANKRRDQTIKAVNELVRIGIDTRDKILGQKIKSLAYNVFLLSVWSQLAVIADHHHNHFSNLIEQIIQNTKGSKRAKYNSGEIISILTTPTTPFLGDIAKKELESLRTKIKKNPKHKEKYIKQHLERWFWLNHGQLGPGLTRQKILHDLKQLKYDGEGKKALAIKQQRLANELGLTTKDKQILDIAKIFVYLRGIRLEAQDSVWAVMSLVIEKIARQTGIKKEYLRYCSVVEIIDYLSNATPLPNVSQLKMRRKLSIWAPKNVFETKIFTGESAKKYIRNNINLSQKIATRQKEVTGSVAFPGKVIGIVKVVNWTREMKKMKQGDIMVSVQTMPELLPAMKKARAFVTDIGGITSHAAIVSREMKVPCIVGTKIATQIFKDGDRVEVDATNGVVKKI